MKALGIGLAAAMVGALGGGCSSSATDCATQACTGSARNYQLCATTTSETWNFGGMSCRAQISSTTAVEACASQVASYCSGGSGGGTTGGQPTGCSYLVSGAQTGSGNCTVAAVEDGSGLRFTVSDASALEFAATFTGSASLTPGAYPMSRAAPGFAAEYHSGTDAYVMCSTTDNCSGASPQGSFTLNVSSPGASQAGGGQTAWFGPQGNLVLTLPAQPGTAASGTVTVTVTL